MAMPELSDTDFINTTHFHNQTAGTSENANSYGDHLQLVKGNAAAPPR